MESPGRVGGDSVGDIYGLCTRLVEAVSNIDSSVVLLAPCIVGRG